MDSFTGVSVTKLRTDINKALEAIAEEHGISLSIGGFRYSPTECSTKITAICAKGKDGEVLDPFEKAYLDEKRKHPRMRDIGDMFESRGTTFTICGWKPRNRKYPLLAKNEVGVMYKLPGRHAYND